MKDSIFEYTPIYEDGKQVGVEVTSIAGNKSLMITDALFKFDDYQPCVTLNRISPAYDRRHTNILEPLKGTSCR